MKTDYPRYIISFSVLLLLTWILSCSGRPGKKSVAGIQPAPVINEEVSSKLFKIISPDENAGFKLHDPLKVVLSLEDKKKVPDSVAVYFNGTAVTTIKSEHVSYTHLLYTSPSPRD